MDRATDGSKQSLEETNGCSRGRSCHTTKRRVPKSIEYHNGDDHHGSSHYWCPHARSFAAASGNDSSFRVVFHEDAWYDDAYSKGYATSRSERDTEAAEIGSVTGEASWGVSYE